MSALIGLGGVMCWALDAVIWFGVIGNEEFSLPWALTFSLLTGVIFAIGCLFFFMSWDEWRNR